jgi:DMSO/TMAO reductase YedYZ molybdopterin-dependent catalytic subunit
MTFPHISNSTRQRTRIVTLMASSAAQDPPRAAAPATCGILAAATALALSELLAGFLPSVPSLVLAVGAGVIDLAPSPLKNVAVAVFGTADKPALLAGVVILSGIAGAGLGIAAARRFSIGIAGFTLFGLLGAAAGLFDPQASAFAGIASATLSTLAGTWVLRQLLNAIPTQGTRDERRRFLALAGVTSSLALIGVVSGRWLFQGRALTLAQREAVRLPRANRILPSPEASTSLDVPGLFDIVTPNAQFYRIDTALSVPQVDLTQWRLSINGMVDRPTSFSFDDLLGMDLIEADITLCCVSNEVGGDLIGNARWLGVPLAHLLDRVGVQPGAAQIVGHSVDGWTGGFPTEAARDGRNALVAIGMNGEPLPVEHGFPARLVVPGLYGYVSATKWLSRIQLVTWEGFDGYWIVRGWSKEGPIKTQSRIDVPKANAVVTAGPTAIAGVAWAQHRGIQRVEVQIDDRPWREARLAGELHVDTWRQWVFAWHATPGTHRIRVRATDATGETQTGVITPSAPSGATGYHTIRVTVT